MEEVTLALLRKRGERVQVLGVFTDSDIANTVARRARRVLNPTCHSEGHDYELIRLEVDKYAEAIKKGLNCFTVELTRNGQVTFVQEEPLLGENCYLREFTITTPRTLLLFWQGFAQTKEDAIELAQQKRVEWISDGSFKNTSEACLERGETNKGG